MAALEAHSPALTDPYAPPPVGSTVTVTCLRHRGYAHVVATALRARWPHADLAVANFAVGGATSADVLARIAAEPAAVWDLAVLGCGTNDVWSRLRTGERAEESRDRYDRNLRAALAELSGRARRVFVVAAPPIGWLDGADTEAINRELTGYERVAGRAAADAGAGFVTVRERFTATATQLGWVPGVPGAPAAASLWQVDGVHLTDLGNHLVAEAILGAL